MSNTITIDRADLRDLVLDFQDICQMLDTRSGIHMRTSPMVLINRFKRQCEATGVHFFGAHMWEQIEELAAELQGWRHVARKRAFGA